MTEVDSEGRPLDIRASSIRGARSSLEQLVVTVLYAVLCIIIGLLIEVSVLVSFCAN